MHIYLYVFYSVNRREDMNKWKGVEGVGRMIWIDFGMPVKLRVDSLHSL